MRKALVVGLNNYPKAPLYGCENDALAVSELLSSNGDGSPNFAVRVCTDISSKSQLKKSIIELFSGDSETALFYYSGHGAQENENSYIVTPDYSDHDLGLSMTEVLEIANKSRSKNKIIILDCCFSGAFGNPSILGGRESLLGEGVTILTASKKDEVSVEVCGHGVFTTLLLEALKGGAADITGKITPGGVYSYIDKALGPWDQRPVFKTNISQFLCLRKVTPKVPLEVIREIVNYFKTPEEEFSLNPSFEFTNNPTIVHETIEPYAIPEKVSIFKDLQKYVSAGLVEPVDEEHMYFAAMRSKNCKLTALGWHYWKLVKDKRI